MKIKTKLFLVNVILVVALFTSITYLLVERSSAAILKHVKQNASVTLSQLSQNLDQKLASYELIANTLYLNAKLQDVLLQDYTSPQDSYRYYFDILQPFVSTVRTTQDIKDLVFYTTNPTFLFSNVVFQSEHIRQTNPWIEQLREMPSGSEWTSSGRGDGEVFSLKQRLNYIDPDTELMVSIEMSKQVLYNLVNKESIGKQIIIALPGGEVLLDTHGAQGSAFIHDYAFYDQLRENGIEGEFEFESEGETFIVFHRALQSRNVVRGMEVIMLVSLEDLLPEIQRTRNLSFLLLVICCAVSALLIYLFASGIMSRLTELAVRMREVQKDDNFSTQIKVKGKDEISQLGNSFNRMVRHLDELIHEVYKGEIDRKELELRIKEAELYALQTQINPHFLYNVLNSIRGNLLERGDVVNAGMISLLAKSFRILLKSRGAVVTLREEAELVTIYLRIQEYRFGERLSFDIEIPDLLAEVRVPTMSLQPIVENAITHVVERSEMVTRIEVKAEAEDTKLLISVRDNGSGMTSERLSQIKVWLSDLKFKPREAHFGLWNVHQRLVKLYGPNSGLSVDSNAEGTLVLLTIPINKEGTDA